MDRRTTAGNELTIVRWKDNKSVYVASNCDSSESQAPEEEFYQQNDKSMLKLGMTRLTITRVVARNKEGVVIVVRIHKKLFQSVVLDFTTTVFRSGLVLSDT